MQEKMVQFNNCKYVLRVKAVRCLTESLFLRSYLMDEPTIYFSIRAISASKVAHGSKGIRQWPIN